MHFHVRALIPRDFTAHGRDPNSNKLRQYAVVGSKLNGGLNSLFGCSCVRYQRKEKKKK